MLLAMSLLQLISACSNAPAVAAGLGSPRPHTDGLAQPTILRTQT